MPVDPSAGSADDSRTTRPGWMHGPSRGLLVAAVVLFLVPLLHPAIRPTVGVTSHLLWFVHAVPVVVAGYYGGFRRGLLVVLGSGLMVWLFEGWFGEGYGHGADMATRTAMGIAVGVIGLLGVWLGWYLRTAERARRTARDIMSVALDTSPDAMLLANEHGEIRYVNDKARSLFALPESAEGSIRHLVPGADGAPLASTVPKGEWSAVLPLPDGRRLPAEIVSSPVTGEDGHLLGCLFSIHDRSAELRMAAEARRQEALVDLGMLVSGIAHDLNNPIASVQLHCEVLAQWKEQLPPEAAQTMEVIREEGARASLLARRLLERSRGREAPVTTIDLNDVARRSVRAHEPQFAAHGVRVEMILDDGEHPILVEGIVGELERILGNLLLNAEFAMHRNNGGGRIRVSTTWVDGTALLTVEDDGPGVPPELRETLFDAFVTTKGKEGTGLGLAVARRLARLRAGDLVLVESGLGGAAFRLSLPGVRGTGVPESGTIGEAPDRHPTPTQLLVVDDEPAILSALERYLAGQGYEVHVATSHAEAIRIARTVPIDAVLCDQRLGEERGIDLHRALAGFRPGLVSRFILMSGDPSQPETVSFARETGAPVLAKPFDLDELLTELLRLAVQPRPAATVSPSVPQRPTEAGDTPSRS